MSIHPAMISWQFAVYSLATAPNQVFMTEGQIWSSFGMRCKWTNHLVKRTTAVDRNADRSANYQKGVTFTNLNCAGCLGRWLPKLEWKVVEKGSGWWMRNRDRKRVGERGESEGVCLWAWVSRCVCLRATRERERKKDRKRERVRWLYEDKEESRRRTGVWIVSVKDTVQEINEETYNWKATPC